MRCFQLNLHGELFRRVLGRARRGPGFLAGLGELCLVRLVASLDAPSPRLDIRAEFQPVLLARDGDVIRDGACLSLRCRPGVLGEREQSQSQTRAAEVLHGAYLSRPRS